MEIENAKHIKVRKAFTGTIAGVVLYERQHNYMDKHVVFGIVTGGVEGWSLLSQNLGSSSYWLPEFIELLQEAHDWCEANCKPHITTY